MTLERQALLRRNGLDLQMTIVAQGKPGAVDGWLYADEVRGLLKKLFGLELSSQAVVGRLTAMCDEDVPRFGCRDTYGREKQYRVTQWGRNDIENKLPGLRRV